ncbi:MAG: DUF1932 domain-containing protein [Anaerolineaceae bacterium]|nr:DUF1932 domain-containing protein [Anaerolineaceae bacterium]
MAGEGKRFGILHPGEMGASVAATLKNGGHEVCWASEGRSVQTIERAEAQQLQDVFRLERLCRECDVLVSVCPPHAAEALAAEVIQRGFRGRYLDANAISPARSRRMDERMRAAGADYVDGGITGGPAWQRGTTWLLLSGPRADETASYFAAGPLETEVLSERIGDASALKMCFAGLTKGHGALQSAVLAAAESGGLRAALERQWQRRDEKMPQQAEQRARNLTAKAWRFAGEMDEIADFFAEQGLPADFHRAAAVMYRRMAHFKDESELPALTVVLAALLQEEVQ